MLSLGCRLKERPTLQEIEKLTISETSMKGAILLTRYFDNTAMRVSYQLECPSLTPKQQILYEALPATLTWDLAVKVGRSIKISESTVRRMLNQPRLFRRTMHGRYEKRLL
jgi:hypothetical protein